MLNAAAISNLFKAVADPARLRILHLLCAEELSVGELVRILSLPQSTVSRHLKTLRDEGIVADRPEGAATFYRAALEAESGNEADTRFRDSLASLLNADALPPADREGLERVLATREAAQEGFFDRIGLHWDALREDCFGPSFHLEAFLHLLPAEWTVADLGTGTGYLLPALARRFARVIAVDASAPMLELARGRIDAEDAVKVDLRAGTLEHLPLRDGEADLAVAFLMLHHLPDIPQALREIHRTVRPGGRLLAVELHPHTNEAFRVRMADRRGGVALGDLRAWLGESGFRGVEAWDFPPRERPEHELAPMPRLYGLAAQRTP